MGVNNVITDSNGDGLVDNSGEYQAFHNGTGVTLRGSNGKALSDSSSPAWDVIKVVNTNSGFRLLLEGSSNRQNQYQIRDAGQDGTITSNSQWKETNDALQFNWESIFGDINGDNVIGFVPTDSDSDGLVDGANNYSIYSAGTAIPITNIRGKVLSSIHSRNWDIAKAIEYGSKWRILFTGKKEFKGKYKVIDADQDGNLSSGINASQWKTSRWILEHGYSKLFDLSTPDRELIRLSNIKSNSEDDWFGGRVELSSDGNRLAVSARRSNSNGDQSGQVSIYNWNSCLSKWQLLGQPINGESSGHAAGYSVALSDNGNRVVLSSPFNNQTSRSNNFRRGQIRTYDWNGSSWQKISDLYGQKKDDRAGYAIKLANNGNILAISAHMNDNSRGFNAGNVRVFQWLKNSWSQIGNDIKGEKAGDMSGQAISLSQDGKTIAIGSYLNDGKSYSNAQQGHVRVYDYNGSDWIQIGQDIDGEKNGDFSGSYIDLSQDGKLIAISALANDGNGQSSGHVRIYNLNESTNTWVQQGQDIDGEEANDYFGWSPQFLDSNTKLLVGALDWSSESDSGEVRLYEWDGMNWEQILENIIGGNAGDKFGASISVTNDGSKISVGAPGTSKGYVTTYSLLPTYSSDIKDENNDGLRDGLVTKYQIVDEGAIIDIKKPNGQIISASSDPCLKVIASTKSNSGYRVLLKNSIQPEEQFQIRDTNLNGVITGYTSWKTTREALDLEWETDFGDFTGDGIIGFPLIDSDGDGLVDGTIKYQALQNGSAITLKTSKGKTYSNSTNPNWDVIKAVGNNSGIRFLFKGTGSKNDEFQIRDADINGVITDRSQWKTTNKALQLDWEEIFGDFNGDGIIGFAPTDSDGDGLVDGAIKYQAFHNGSSITFKSSEGKTYSDASNPTWNIIKAVKGESGFRFLLEGLTSKQDKYQIRDTNSIGIVTKNSRWKTTHDAVTSGWESIFGDFNGNGVIDNAT